MLNTCIPEKISANHTGSAFTQHNYVCRVFNVLNVQVLVLFQFLQECNFKNTKFKGFIRLRVLQNFVKFDIY